MKRLMLDHYTIRAIAEEVVKVMEEKKMPNLVTTKEAAKILGITPRRLRQIKERFGYVKDGDNMQGRLLFNADTLSEFYIR